MSVCREVKQWITREVQVPVEKAITEARRACEKLKKAIEEQVQKPVEKWISREERRCKRRSCNWWCLCCNKWFCWLVTVVAKIVTWVLVTIIKWVTYLVCKIVMVVVEIVVKLVLRVLKFLVTVFVCLFTGDWAGLGLAFADLWSDLVTLIQDVIAFVKSLLDDVVGILDDVIKFLHCLGDSFGPVGRWLFGIAAGVVEIGKKVVDLGRDLLTGVEEIVAGLLRLNVCRMQMGLTNLGTSIGRAIITATGAFFGATIGGPRQGFKGADLRDIIGDALEEAFGDDSDAIEAAEEIIGINCWPFGLTMQLDARRMVIRSGPFLRSLHEGGVIDLYQIAGHLRGPCEGSWSTSTRHVLGEVVYTGTTTTVSYADLDDFLSGREGVPGFSVYAIRYANYWRYLEVARQKAFQVGVDLVWDEIGDYEVTDETFLPLATRDNDDLFAAFGRTGDDDLCTIPVLAIFLYEDESLNGLASWFRPPPYDNPCPISADDNRSRRSGVSFRDRNPEYVWKFVAIHEIGHYLGLCHDGHDGPELIMYTARGGFSVTARTVIEYVLLATDPYFNREDAEEVWRWLTEVAGDDCLR